MRLGGPAGICTCPATHLDTRFSALGADATPWADAREALAAAEIIRRGKRGGQTRRRFTS